LVLFIHFDSSDCILGCIRIMILEACSVSYSVDRYMRKDIATVDAEVSAVGASKIMLEKNVGYLVVLENAQPSMLKVCVMA
jgi:predicted transcriptional regulator